jgi:hypothetical protein
MVYVKLLLAYNVTMENATSTLNRKRAQAKIRAYHDDDMRDKQSPLAVGRWFVAEDKSQSLKRW